MILPEGYKRKSDPVPCEKPSADRLFDCGFCEACKQNPWWWGGSVWAGDFQDPTRLLEQAQSLRSFPKGSVERNFLETLSEPVLTWTWSVYHEGLLVGSGSCNTLEEAAAAADKTYKEAQR